MNNTMMLILAGVAAYFLLNKSSNAPVAIAQSGSGATSTSSTIPASNTAPVQNTAQNAPTQANSAPYSPPQTVVSNPITSPPPAPAPVLNNPIGASAPQPSGSLLIVGTTPTIAAPPTETIAPQQTAMLTDTSSMMSNTAPQLANWATPRGSMYQLAGLGASLSPMFQNAQRMRLSPYAGWGR